MEMTAKVARALSDDKNNSVCWFEVLMHRIRRDATDGKTIINFNVDCPDTSFPTLYDWANSDIVKKLIDLGYSVDVKYHGDTNLITNLSIEW